MQVFLSYARGDATAEADQLRNMLDNTGLRSWIDRHELPAGENWWPEAEKAIVGADAFVLLISPESVRSEAVKREYSLALKLHKHFLPVLVKETALPPDLAPLTYRNLTGGKFANGLTQLIGDLQAIWEKARRSLNELSVPPLNAVGWTPIPGELAPLVQELELHTSRNMRPPEVYFAFGDLLRAIRDEKAKGRPLVEVLDEFVAGGQGPPQWAPVIATHRPYFTTLLQPVRNLLRPERTGKPVTVVLIVMTKAEAQELESGAAFANSPADIAVHFKDLQLPAQWIDAYAATPEQWTPYPGSRPIGQLIRDRIGLLSAAGKSLYADFIDIRTIRNLSFPEIRKLRYEGCLVIMDVLSIFHPKLHEAYLRSMLCAQEKALLVEVLPSQSFPDLQDVTITFKKRLDLEFWDRYAGSDNNCKQILRPVDLTRFLDGELPTTSGVFAFIRPQ